MKLLMMLAVVAAVCLMCCPGFAQGPGAPGISTEILPPAAGPAVGSCAGPACGSPAAGQVIWVGPPVYGPPTVWVPAPMPGPAHPCRYPGHCPPAYWPGHPHGHGLPHPPAAYHYDARSRRSVGLSLRLDWSGRDRLRESGFGHQ